MRTVLSIERTADLPPLAGALRASRARLADATVSGDELSLPIEYPDSANVELRPTVPGAAAGMVPILEARLVIRDVVASKVDVSADSPTGRIEAAYHPKRSTWVVSDGAGSSIELTVKALNASVETTDQRIGQQRLSSLM